MNDTENPGHDDDDAIGELVDWQLNNVPVEQGWSCPDCGMNWTQQPSRCPCAPEPGQPNAATLELCFWEALKRCALDEDVPMSLKLCDGTEESGVMTLPNPLPPQLWRYMASAHAELRTAAGV